MAKFQPGTSGNVKGRPVGVGRHAEIRSALDTVLPSVLKKLVSQALAGDTQASKIIVSACLPPLKPADPTAPIAMAGKTLTAKAESIIEAIAEGQVGVDAGAQLVAMLQRVGELRGSETLELRIEALEAIAAKQRD